MRRTILLLVVLGVVVLVGARAVQAQSTIDPRPVMPPSCTNVAPFDHNRDGKLDWRDFEMWVLAVHEGGETCRLNGPASGCPTWVDVNGDGIVTVADVQAMDQFLNWCIVAPRHTGLRPGQ